MVLGARNAKEIKIQSISSGKWENSPFPQSPSPHEQSGTETGRQSVMKMEVQCQISGMFGVISEPEERLSGPI